MSSAFVPLEDQALTFDIGSRMAKPVAAWRSPSPAAPAPPRPSPTSDKHADEAPAQRSARSCRRTPETIASTGENEAKA